MTTENNLEQSLQSKYGASDFFRSINTPIKAIKKDVQETYKRFKEDESGWKYANKVIKPVKGFTERFLGWVFEPREWERRNNAATYRRSLVKKLKPLFKKKEDELEKILKQHFNIDMPRIEGIKKENRAEKLRKYEKMTRIYEAVCWKATEYTLFPGAPLIAYEWGLKGLGVASAIWVPMVGLPLMVQRMNRARIYNLLDKIESDNSLKLEDKNYDKLGEGEKC
ncbi:hypothetical protein HY837_00160 [archaeon]|nr:hypothetical protein [archaeon]